MTGSWTASRRFAPDILLVLVHCLGRNAYIKLPSFHVFASLLVRNNHDKLRDLATHHPLVQLRHDLLDIGFDLVVGGNYSRLVGSLEGHVSTNPAY